MSRLVSESIVLKRKELLNKDIVYTLFTPELGKIKVMAKGIMSISSRRSPHLQTGNLIDTVLYRRNDFYYLQETQLKSAFSTIKGDSKKMSFLYFVLYIIDRLLPESQKEEIVYETLKKFMIKLSKMEVVDIDILNKYLSLILIQLGYIDKKKEINELHEIIQGLINEKVPLFVI